MIGCEDRIWRWRVRPIAEQRANEGISGGGGACLIGCAVATESGYRLKHMAKHSPQLSELCAPLHSLPCLGVWDDAQQLSERFDCA